MGSRRERTNVSTKPTRPATEWRALVKWLTGKEAGSYTHNLDIEWILNFDRKSDFRANSHVIEWRVPPMPKGGWDMWDALVLEVSDDIDFLQTRMEQEQEKAGSSAVARVPPTPASSPALAAAPAADLQSLLSKFLTSIASPSSSVVTDENQVKVGQSLMISKTAFLEAKLARTPTAMTMDLVRAAFTQNRLRRSSYAGQKRTINGVTKQKPGLKKYRRMKDIQNYVNERFPAFSQSAFGHAVSAVTGRNVDRRPTRELVEKSESESDGDSDD